jgi:hypothetical protein
MNQGMVILNFFPSKFFNLLVKEDGSFISRKEILIDYGVKALCQMHLPFHFGNAVFFDFDVDKIEGQVSRIN